MSRTEEKAKEFRELEVVLGALDQYASSYGPPFSRACSRMYTELLKLREDELGDWHMLHRCDNAMLPYHTPGDGPCEVYTVNYQAGAHIICDTCAKKEAA